MYNINIVHELFAIKLNNSWLKFIMESDIWTTEFNKLSQIIGKQGEL